MMNRIKSDIAMTWENIKPTSHWKLSGNQLTRWPTVCLCLFIHNPCFTASEVRAAFEQLPTTHMVDQRGKDQVTNAAFQPLSMGTVSTEYKYTKRHKYIANTEIPRPRFTKTLIKPPSCIFPSFNNVNTYRNVLWHSLVRICMMSSQKRYSSSSKTESCHDCCWMALCWMFSELIKKTGLRPINAMTKRPLWLSIHISIKCGDFGHTLLN